MKNFYDLNTKTVKYLHTIHTVNGAPGKTEAKRAEHGPLSWSQLRELEQL